MRNPKRAKSGIVALFLILSLLCPVFASCGGGAGEETKSRKESKTGSETSAQTEEDRAWWENVNFGGDSITVNVSVAVNSEQTFGAGDIYTRGPDSLANAKDSVEKMIFDRDRNIEDKLGLTVVWQETNQPVGQSASVLENFVKLNAENSPDIFLNDAYDLIQSMLNGMLWNLLDNRDAKGEEITSYFDFENPCWYREYMRGSTVRQDKIYIASGNAFLDMLRYAYVIYVNRAMFDEVMATQCITVHELYEDVLSGYWDYESFKQYIELGFRDTDPGGVATTDDEQLGLTVSQLFYKSFTWNSGASVVQWEGDAYDSTPYIPDENSDLFEYAEKFSALWNTAGIYYFDGTASPRVCMEIFLNNQALFTLSMMGELESEQVRASGVDKGVLPLPRYDLEKTDDYRTLVHDQAEVGCILGNTQKFTEASAWLQLLNETSDNVLTEYYEKSLKMRYNDDADTKAMIDLIHGKMSVPFDIIITNMITSGKIDGGNELPGAVYFGRCVYYYVFYDARDRKNAFTSSYASALDGWRGNLEVLVDLFDELQ